MKDTRTGSEAAIYVSDYATYNNGSLSGKWITLDGKTAEEIHSEIQAVLKQNEILNQGQWICEEVMVQDYQGFPHQFYSECMVFDKSFEILIEYLALDTDDRERFDACLENNYDLEQAFKSYEEVWICEDFDDYLDQIGFWQEIPEHLHCYIDEEAVKRDYIDGYNLLELDDKRIVAF